MDEMPRGIINGERGIADSQERPAELSTSLHLLQIALAGLAPKARLQLPTKNGEHFTKIKKKKIAESG